MIYLYWLRVKLCCGVEFILLWHPEQRNTATLDRFFSSFFFRPLFVDVSGVMWCYDTTIPDPSQKHWLHLSLVLRQSIVHCKACIKARRQ